MAEVMVKVVHQVVPELLDRHDRAMTEQPVKVLVVLLVAGAVRVQVVAFPMAVLVLQVLSLGQLHTMLEVVLVHMDMVVPAVAAMAEL